jgi:hypothetical protein
MVQPLNIIIVEKTGLLKSLSIKDYKEDELFKKCGFKKAEDFIKQIEWNIKYPSGSSGIRYYIEVFAKTEGRPNSENKYDFPPPIDKKLFFGNCAIVMYVKNLDGTKKCSDLSIQLWDKLYEKLFGGFEDLALTAIEDEEEEDELEKVPKHKKTKDGYLKDGFVVDNSECYYDSDGSHTSDSEDDEDEETETTNKTKEEDDDEILIEDIGSELSEESYDYESEEDNNIKNKC